MPDVICVVVTELPAQPEPLAQLDLTASPALLEMTELPGLREPAEPTGLKVWTAGAALLARLALQAQPALRERKVRLAVQQTLTAELTAFG
jgi:hypothetical protein